MDDLPQQLGIPEPDWARTPASVQAVVCALVQVVQDQQLQLQAALARIAVLEAEVADLRAQLNQHSQNSSKPPSSNPPGHPRDERPTPDPDHIDAVRDHFPVQCPRCQTGLANRQQDACLPQIQFEWELPEVRPFITAHQYHTVSATSGRPPACCGRRSNRRS
jgi:transposase